VDAQYIAPSAAACKQVVLRGTAIDLRSLEETVPGTEGVPSLNKVLLASRDPDSGAIGLTLAALHPQGPRIASIRSSPESPFSRHRAAATIGGGPLEVAALLGNDPSLPLLALMPLAAEEDAYLCASALREAPLVITDCESTDLEIPARGEIVLEGLVDGSLTESREHAPPLLTIHTMTHRRDPLFEVQPHGERGAEARLLAAWAAASQAAKGGEGG
jgi:4-hydroxy-3-polyprenylbenzoate decarboxylase